MLKQKTLKNMLIVTKALLLLLLLPSLLDLFAVQPWFTVKKNN